jgi:hypothetical protein
MFKSISFFYSLAILMLSTAGIYASQQYENLAKLVKSGANETVIIAYINACDSSYNLSSDEIVQLKELGASSPVIVTAIQHNKSVPTEIKQDAAAQTTIVRPIAYEVYRGQPYWRPWRASDISLPIKNLDKMKQALQLDVAGLMQGVFSLNYEYLLVHQHGIVVEGSYYSGWGWDSHGENAELAYRWHWAKSMNSGFLGAFVKYSKDHGDQRDVWDRRMGDTAIAYNQKSFTVGPDLGKRWVSPWGLNIVARVGYGYTWSKFDNPIPDQSTRNRLRLMQGFDSEVSFGYAF